MSNFELTSEEKKKNGDMIKEIQTLAGKPVLSPKHLVKNTPPGTMSNNQENNLADYDDMNDDDQAPAGQKPYEFESSNESNSDEEDESDKEEVKLSPGPYLLTYPNLGRMLKVRSV